MRIRHTDLVFCRKNAGTQSIETAGEWESEVVDACVAVCGEQEAALKIVSALVTTLKHPEASEVRHGASQVPGATSRFLSVCIMLPTVSYVEEVSCCSRHVFVLCTATTSRIVAVDEVRCPVSVHHPQGSSAVWF